MGDDATTYPNLGFNPVPGVPDHVEALGGKVSTAVDSLTQANELLGRLRNSGDSVWQGDAGNAFREHFNGKLAQDLTAAHTSLDKAVGVLRDWHTNLVSFKDTAAKLDQEAGQVKQDQAHAQTELQHAQSNPALKLAGQGFPDQEALQQAQRQIDSAEGAVRAAGSKLANAEDLLSSIMKRARELEGEHDAVARKVAAELKDATKHLAPDEPGWLSRMFSNFTSALETVGGWVKDHLSQIHSVLTTISAIAGVVALCTPPPIDAIALGVAVVASAGALGCDLADPKFRHGIGQLVHGHFDKQSLGAAMTGVTDVMGVIPGVSVASKAIKGGEAAAEGASVFSRIVDAAHTVAENPGLVAKAISRVPGVETAMQVTKLPEVLGKTEVQVVGAIWKGKSAVSDLYKDAKEYV